jgi:lysophospholipase L1-like esterase
MIYIMGLVFAAMLLSACSSLVGSDQPQSTKFKEIESQEWQYVVLGDSSTRGYPEILAEKIEQDQGVSVEVILWSRGGDHSTRLLGRLQTVESLREDIANAELITFVIPWNVFEAPALIYTSATPERCGGEDNQDCLREALEIYKQDTEAIIAELDSLIDRDSTIILAHTVWQFNVTLTKQTGDFKVLNKYWKEANAHLISVCEEYGIPVAQVYEAFMGTDDSKNPEEDGLIYDGFHTTPEGQEIIADLLFDLGD